MFSLNSANSVTKVFVIAAKGFKPATSCVRDQDAPFRKTQISSRCATISNHEKSCVVFCFAAAVNEAHELLPFNWTW